MGDLTLLDFSDSLPKDLADVPLPLMLPTEDIEGCKPYKTSLDGAIAFIRRGTCSFVQKVRHLAITAKNSIDYMDRRKKRWALTKILLRLHVSTATDQAGPGCWRARMHLLQQCRGWTPPKG